MTIQRNALILTVTTENKHFTVRGFPCMTIKNMPTKKLKSLPILMRPAGMKMGECQRPLRASTAQGERIALAHSETCPAGTAVELEIVCLDKGHEKLVKELLDYGKMRGLGQWRNSGKGRFTWEEKV
jgi:hypothetical protein